MTTISDYDIERILKVKDADLGLFVLAMHSLMERALKEKYNSDADFGELIKDYVRDYRYENGNPSYYGGTVLPKDKWGIYNLLRDLYENHFLSNDVRHQFAEISDEGAKATVTCFLAFAEAEGWTQLQTIKKLEAELENWKKHDKYQSEELKRAIAEISRLKSENKNLAQKANELKVLQSKLETLSAKEKALKSELAENEANLSKKNAKLDQIRKKANEQCMSLKAEKDKIQEQLKDYEKTRKYVEILEKVSFYTKTRHDYEQSIITLSREQLDVLDQINMNSDYLVKGAAGTGKSLVLIKTLEKAVNGLDSELSFDENPNRFRLLTYTKSLVKYNQYVTKLLNAEVPEDTITTADSFTLKIARKFYPYIEKFVYDNYCEIPEGVFEDGDFTGQQVYIEAQNFIWANRITKQQYVDEVCDREGMKFPIKKDDRIKLWSQLEKAEQNLIEEKLWPRNFAAKKILESIEQNGAEVDDIMAEYSFIDEAQDLPPVMLAVIKKCTKRAVFLAGDSDQSIYTKGFNWNKSGINIVGHTKILKTNFRNTVQIHKYAEEYRDTFKNKDATTTPDAFRPGPPVEHIVADNFDDAMNQMAEQVKLLMNALGYAEENICIIANAKTKLEKVQNYLDEKLGVESHIIHDYFDFEGTKGVRLCTMQNCKGLDFPVVLFLADHRNHGSDENSAYDADTFMTQQYNMVYVALTRAMEMLYVYTIKNSTYEPFTRLK